MIPKFLMLSEHPASKMRSHAIACLSYFVPISCQALFANIDAFIACLFKRASDDDAQVRRHVCQALVLLLASRPEKLMPEMANVAEYMLYSTKDKNENVALEACEFWLTFAEDPDLAPWLAPLLGQVAPVLLDCMVYGEDDLIWLENDAEDAAVPDKDTDIKPRHYGGKSHGFERDANGDSVAKPPRVGAYGEELEELVHALVDALHVPQVEWEILRQRTFGANLTLQVDQSAGFRDNVTAENGEYVSNSQNVDTAERGWCARDAVLRRASH